MRNLLILTGLVLGAAELAAQTPAPILPPPAAPNPADIPAAPTFELPAPAPAPKPVAPASRDTGYAAILNRPKPPRKPLQVDEPPVIQDVPVWYFPKGKMKHQAVVKFSAYIDSTGRVESDSLRIISLSDTSFAAAARFTLLGAQYRPALYEGKPVRTWVIQTVRYRGDWGRRCELDAVTPMLPTPC